MIITAALVRLIAFLATYAVRSAVVGGLAMSLYMVRSRLILYCFLAFHLVVALFVHGYRMTFDVGPCRTATDNVFECQVKDELYYIAYNMAIFGWCTLAVGAFVLQWDLRLDTVVRVWRYRRTRAAVQLAGVEVPLDVEGLAQSLLQQLDGVEDDVLMDEPVVAPSRVGRRLRHVVLACKVYFATTTLERTKANYDAVATWLRRVCLAEVGTTVGDNTGGRVFDGVVGLGMRASNLEAFLPTMVELVFLPSQSAVLAAQLRSSTAWTARAAQAREQPRTFGLASLGRDRPLGWSGGVD